MRALGYPPELGVRALQAAAQARSAGRRRSCVRRDRSPSASGFDLDDAARARDCSPRCARSRECRACARRTPAGSCCRPRRSAITARSSRPTMGRTIIQFDKDDLDSSACRSSTFSGSARSRACGARSTRSRRVPATRPEMYRLPIDDRRHIEHDRARRHDRHVPDREPRADRVDPAHAAGAALRHRRAGRADPARPDPGASSCGRTRERRRGRGAGDVRGIRRSSRSSSARRGSRSSRSRRWRLSMALGGYTADEADGLRRTMGNQRKEARLEAALDDAARDGWSRTDDSTRA